MYACLGDEDAPVFLQLLTDFDVLRIRCVAMTALSSITAALSLKSWKLTRLRHRSRLEGDIQTLRDLADENVRLRKLEANKWLIDPSSDIERARSLQRLTRNKEEVSLLFFSLTSRSLTT